MTRRRQIHLLGWLVALFLVHATFYSAHQIEDAAITYAFSRNLVLGEGFVVNPGGTWVEGFSNPVWTLMLAGTTLLGLPIFGMSKVLGVGAAALTLPAVWWWAKRLQDPGDTSLWPAFTALILATSCQFTLWAAAGLENGTMNLFLVLGVVGLLWEGDENAPRVAWSGIPMGLLALSRPEAPMYAGLLVLVLGPRALRRGGWRWLLTFGALSGIPFIAWHVWSTWAFGWALPNTYYAKEPSERWRPLLWNNRTWQYTMGWAFTSAHGFYLPAFALAMGGAIGRRAWMAAVAVGLVLLVTLPGIGWIRELIPLPDEPDVFIHIRIVVYILAALALGILAATRNHAPERLAAWVVLLVAVFFSIFSGGDWMRGFRFYSPATLPLAILVVDGLRWISTWLGARSWWHERLPRGDLLLTVLIAPLVITGVWQSVEVISKPDTTPFEVRRRVLHYWSLADRLHIDRERISHSEIDMGGNVYWSGFEITDIAGLVDVPIGHHHYETPFITEYFGKERRPTIVHVHGGWSNKVGLERQGWFKADYLEIPPFAHTQRVWHLGTFLRRDTLQLETWPHPDGRTMTYSTLHLEGLYVPSPEVHAGGALYLEIGWGAHPGVTPFRPLVFLADQAGQVVFTADLPPAYDMHMPDRWAGGQVFLGRHTLDLPTDLPDGDYDLGLVVLRDDVPRPPANPHPTPVFSENEVRWEGAVKVRSAEQVARQAEALLGEARALATATDCAAAEQTWERARRHLSRDDPWQAPTRAAFEDDLARCWAALALASTDEAVDPEAPDQPRRTARHIEAAREYNHRLSEVEQASAVLADRWELEGDAAAERGDVEATWRGWRDALMADPARPKLRRRTEALRAQRLGLKQ